MSDVAVFCGSWLMLAAPVAVAAWLLVRHVRRASSPVARVEAAVLALLRTPRGEGEPVAYMVTASRYSDRGVERAGEWLFRGPAECEEHVRWLHRPQSRWQDVRVTPLYAALHPEAQGEEDAVRRTWELAVQRAYGCLDYCGGYRGAELKAFHSGIKTVIRALEAGLDTVDTQTAALDRIGAALLRTPRGEEEA